MKKLIAMALAALMACSIMACGGSEDKKATLVMATNAEFPP